MSKRREKILILGGGDFAADVADVIHDIPDKETAGFVVNIGPYEEGATYLDLPVYWVNSLASIDRSILVICGIAAAARERFVQKVTAMGFSFATAVHPSARVSRKATIGEGSFISGGVQTATHVRIGQHVIVNRGALLGHHCLINDYAIIAPGASLASNCIIGRGATVGMGALIVEHCVIGENSFVGAGSVVTKDVPRGVKIVGNPARIVERNIDRSC